MHNIRRFYNTHKKTIWKVIIGIILLFIVLQILNYNAKNNNINIMGNNNVLTDIDDNYNEITIDIQESPITGEKITEDTLDEITIIDKFFDFCNNNQISEAYNLLTNECKKEMYQNEQVFKELYVDKIFNGIKKNITIDKWISDTYRIEIFTDILEQGTANQTNIQDYITIIETEINGEQVEKLNINSYVGNREISNSKEEKNIIIEMKSQDIYIDYRIVNYKIENNSDKTIIIDELQQGNNIYLLDNKDMKYNAYIHELNRSDMEIQPGRSREISIKYYCKYSTNISIKDSVFSNVVLDYNDWLQTQKFIIPF